MAPTTTTLFGSPPRVSAITWQQEPILEVAVDLEVDASAFWLDL